MRGSSKVVMGFKGYAGRYHKAGGWWYIAKRVWLSTENQKKKVKSRRFAKNYKRIWKQLDILELELHRGEEWGLNCGVFCSCKVFDMPWKLQ